MNILPSGCREDTKRSPVFFLMYFMVMSFCLEPWSPLAAATVAMATTAADTPDGTSADPSGNGSGIVLGISDSVSVQVYGRPELNTTTYVSDDGTITVPLAGSVPVSGLSPAKAGQRIAAAFRKGKFLIDPQVTVFLVQFRSQQVSVLGAVHTPGRFAIESRTTVLDALAQAGGTTDNGADVVQLLRPGKDGKVTRYPINLKGLSQDDLPLPTLTLRGGDSIFVPPADQFYIYGEVRAPNMYRLVEGMTVVQAITRGGGITARGSSRRVEIRHRKSDGSYITRDADLSDQIQANDVIRVKESFF